MFTQSAQLYDEIYHFKDYAAEVERVRAIIEQYYPPAKTLLDVACGTGKHLEELGRHYQAEGLDLNKDLLKVARQRLLEVPLHHGNMVDFDLERKFDVVTCLFSSVGYLKTIPNLQRAISNMARHLAPEGVLILEPWFHPETYYAGKIGAATVDKPELKIVRMNISTVEGRVSIMEMHYLVGTPAGIQHFTERHEMSLFTHEEYLRAFEQAGLQAHHDVEGLIGRGLYIGVRTT